MTSDTERAETKIVQRARAWMEAAARRDAGELDGFLADEFTMVTNRGSLIDKAQWLENMLHRVGRDFTPPEFLDVRVRLYGDAALMTSRNILHTTFDGKDWSGEHFLTDVWVRRDDRWQLVRRHSSAVVPGAS